KQSPIPTLVEPEEGYTLNEQMVTRFFKVRYVEVDRLKGVLQSLVSQPGGDLIAFEPDTLIITDEGANMHRLERIIRQLDAPSSSSELRVIRLNFASATRGGEKASKAGRREGRDTGGAPGPGWNPPAAGPWPAAGTWRAARPAASRRGGRRRHHGARHAQPDDPRRAHQQAHHRRQPG